jgi:hypothetical protein
MAGLEMDESGYRARPMWRKIIHEFFPVKINAKAAVGVAANAVVAVYGWD